MTSNISDPAERARAVARELRRRGIWANAVGRTIWTLRFDPNGDATNGEHAMVWPGQDAMSSREIADRIQAIEAERAAQWAGDNERPEKGTAAVTLPIAPGVEDAAPAHPVKPLPPLPSRNSVKVTREPIYRNGVVVGTWPNAEMVITYPILNDDDRRCDRDLAAALVSCANVKLPVWEFGGRFWCVHTVGISDVRPDAGLSTVATRTIKLIEYLPRPTAIVPARPDGTAKGPNK